jgi:hypothetical protein
MMLMPEQAWEIAMQERSSMEGDDHRIADCG